MVFHMTILIDKFAGSDTRKAVTNIDPLDLSFLSTGKSQHVFVKAGDRKDGWVYKVPAMFGYVLPFDHRDCGFRSPLWRTCCFLLVWVPQGLFKRGFLRLLHIAQRQGWEKMEQFLCRIEPALRALSMVGQRCLAAFLKRVRAKQFTLALDCINYLLARKVRNVLLPCQVLHEQEAILRFDAQCVRYRGPILKQKRADTFFERCGGLDSFSWSAIIEAQHRLWQHGVGLSEPVETLGPYNWALFHGQVRLADTGALTDDVRKVRRCLRDHNLNRTVRRFHSWPEGNDPLPLILKYCAFIRRAINEQMLRRLWKARRAETSVVPGAPVASEGTVALQGRTGGQAPAMPEPVPAEPLRDLPAQRRGFASTKATNKARGLFRPPA